MKFHKTISSMNIGLIVLYAPIKLHSPLGATTSILDADFNILRDYIHCFQQGNMA